MQAIFLLATGIKVPLAILLIGSFYFFIFHSTKENPTEKDDERKWFDERTQNTFHWRETKVK